MGNHLARSDDEDLPGFREFGDLMTVLEDLKAKFALQLEICLLSVDWLMFSLSAALEKCSSSASTIADCSSRISGRTMTIPPGSGFWEGKQTLEDGAFNHRMQTDNCIPESVSFSAE